MSLSINSSLTQQVLAPNGSGLEVLLLVDRIEYPTPTLNVINGNLSYSITEP